MQNQKEFFANLRTMPCERCAKLCRVVDKKNTNAQLFVKGDIKTGRYCTECLVVDFFKNSDMGPMVDDSKKKFDPACLRLPHIQNQFAAIVLSAQERFSAELDIDEFDWDEIIANWHLPFPKIKKRREA